MGGFEKTQDSKVTALVKQGAHGWIQWKGTAVCMDVHCTCGEHTHIDDEFAYFVRCGACGKTWQCNPNIELIEASVQDLKGACEPVLSMTDGSNDR